MSTMQRSRRAFLKSAGAAAGVVAGAALFPRQAYPQTRTLTIWHTEPAGITVKAVQKVCDRFEQLHPGVKVVQEGMSTSTVGVKLLPSLAAGNPPDIAGIAPFFYRSLQKKGQLVPIDDVIQAIGKDDIVEHVRDMTLYKGHYWGIAHQVGVPTLIIRKDFAEQAGFKVPDDVTKPMFKSWTEQVECLRAMTKPEKRQWGLSLPGTGYYFQEHAGRWVSSNGSGFYDRNWNPIFHKENFIQVVEFFRTLAQYKVVPPDWLSQTSVGVNMEFAMGITAMMDHGYGKAAGTIEQYAPDKASETYFKPIWRVPGPLGKEAYTDLDCEPFVIFSKSKNQELAKEWLRLFYSRDLYLNYVKCYPVHFGPVIKSLRNDAEYRALPEFKRWPGWMRQQQEYIDRKLAIYQGVYYPAENIQIPFLAEVNESGIVVDEIMAAIQGRRNAKQAGERITERVNDLIVKLGYPMPDPIRSEKA